MSRPPTAVTLVILCNYMGFESLRFKKYFLPFSKEFLYDYQALFSNPAITIVNMRGILLRRSLKLQEVENKRRDMI